MPADFAATAAQQGWKVLDVRPVPPLDYVAGHAPGAVHLSEQALRGPDGALPFQVWPANDTARILGAAGIANGDAVLVYSDGANVLGATLAAYVLAKSGVPRVAVLDGGFKEFNATQRGAVTKAFPRYQQAAFAPTTVPGLAIPLADVVALTNAANVVIVDPRPKALYEGTDDTFVRGGHIPGAINLPWQAFTEDGNPHKLKPVAAIRALFEKRGVTPDKAVIVSCSTGRESTLQYLLLKHVLGYPDVRLYEGSWTEYSASPHPVEAGPDRSAPASA